MPQAPQGVGLAGRRAIKASKSLLIGDISMDKDPGHSWPACNSWQVRIVGDQDSCGASMWRARAKI